MNKLVFAVRRMLFRQQSILHRWKCIAVHVKEKAESVPSGEKPTEWTLYTSHPEITPQEALQAVPYYRLHWVIEDLFRTIKSKGVDYESSELESGVALRKLFIMVFMAAIRREAFAGFFR